MPLPFILHTSASHGPCVCFQMQVALPTVSLLSPWVSARKKIGWEEGRSRSTCQPNSFSPGEASGGSVLPPRPHCAEPHLTTPLLGFLSLQACDLSLAFSSLQAARNQGPITYVTLSAFWADLLLLIGWLHSTKSQVNTQFEAHG